VFADANFVPIQIQALSNEELDDFKRWNQKIKDYDEFYFAMLRSTRLEMTSWMEEINADFLTQVAMTVDRLNGVSLTNFSDCAEKFRANAGQEIQEIVSEVISDFDSYQRDYVYLLADVTDQYISFNQKWPKTMWAEHNMVMRMDIITYLMETYVYVFYKSLFEAQVEELLYDMEYFRDGIAETKQRSFVALNNIGERLDKNVLTC
jgi:hypothetical protein